MADCVQKSANLTNMRANSEDFLLNVKTTDFALKKATRAFLLENDGCIFCVETTDVDITSVLLGQILIKFKDTILKENLNEIIFTDFSDFTKMSSEDKENFLKYFPDLCVFTMNNEDLFEKQSALLKSLVAIIKIHGKKIIFILENSKHLEKSIMVMDNPTTNIFKLKLEKFWQEKEIVSNDENICAAAQTKIVDNESTSAIALDECAKVSTSDDEATTPTEDFLKALQETGMEESDALDRYSYTLLELAAWDGNIHIVESILSLHGTTKNFSPIALCFATTNGHTEIVNLLLEYGFDINVVCQNNGRQSTLLHEACRHVDAELVEILLIFGAEIEAKNIFGRTALHVASYFGHSAVVNSLLENGANVDAQDNDGQTPLHLAAIFDKPEVVEILLQNGALFNIQNNQQENAIDIAKKNGSTEIVEILENYQGSEIEEAGNHAI